MAIGIKIFHEDPKMRNCVVTVEIPYQLMPYPRLCPTCNITHHRKTYHLRLDDSAGTVVSEASFKQLKDAGLPGFLVEGKVVDPPAATLDMNGSEIPRIIVQRPTITLRDIGV